MWHGLVTCCDDVVHRWLYKDDLPVRLHFDVFAEHVEPHGFACFYVILQTLVTWRCVDSVWPEALQDTVT